MCDQTTYTPLHVHSHYSLLDGLPSPKSIVARCKELGVPACAITDHGNIFGMKAFHDAAKKAQIKPIIGCELYICVQDATIRCPENDKRYHLTVLAKNQRGVETLAALVSETNRPDCFYRKPRINLERLAPFAAEGNLLCLSGCLAALLSTSIWSDLDEACKVSTQRENMDEVRTLLRPDWMDVGAQVIQQYQKVFGKENYFLEIQEEGMTVQKVVIECLRKLGTQLDIPTVATLDAHYCKPEDAEDQRILLYSQLHTTQEEQDRLRSEGGDTMAFFHKDTFHIFSPKEMREKYLPAEIARTMEIADRCGALKLGRQPCLPKFHNDEVKQIGMTSDQYIEHLCVRGAKAKLSGLPADKKKLYWDRVQHELLIIREAGLSDYFLIEWDACNFVDANNGPRGKGRGSGAGSLVNYLLGITDIDPLVYDLYFERFYNASRNIPAHFVVGEVDFMTWLGDNFEAAVKRDKVASRLRLAVAVQYSRRVKNPVILRQEAEWIDANNMKMWLYLFDQYTSYAGKKHENKANSHIAYALGLTDELDETKPVQTVASHVSLPDIDTDIGVVFRSRVIEYLAKRWGEDRVAQMVTFGRLQGKAALKEVFRAQPDTVKQLMRVRAVKQGKSPNEINQKPFDLCNEITAFIPDEAAIADDLRQAREESGDDHYGILQWSIDHIEQVAEYYKWYAPLFDQSMRLEGTKKSQSKHAAGVVIADRPISELVPMVFDTKSKLRVCGLEMSTAEAMGVVKFDFLGVTALDKLWFGQQLVNTHSAAPLIDEDITADEEEEE